MKRFIEGVDRGLSVLFPECLEDWVDDDNPVRVAERAGTRDGATAVVEPIAGNAPIRDIRHGNSSAWAMSFESQKWRSGSGRQNTWRRPTADGTTIESPNISTMRCTARQPVQ